MFARYTYLKVCSPKTVGTTPNVARPLGVRELPGVEEERSDTFITGALAVGDLGASGGIGARIDLSGDKPVA